MTGARQYVGKSIYTMLPDFETRPKYYARRLYGKYTIYNKDGAIVAKGLNEKEMKNYMKLLKEDK